jgi:hypothetical protein
MAKKPRKPDDKTKSPHWNYNKDIHHRSKVKIKTDQIRAMELSLKHTWEWIRPRTAICQDCGMYLNLITTRERPEDVFQKRVRGGWTMKYVWGGNEYGIGGVMSEPSCLG